MKEERTGYIIILCVLAITSVIVYKTIKYINQQEKTYEYVQNGEIGVSNKCYYSDDAYCEVDNKVIKVDCYYEVD